MKPLPTKTIYDIELERKHLTYHLFFDTPLAGHWGQLGGGRGKKKGRFLALSVYGVLWL
jgi:hypothetical protein